MVSSTGQSTRAQHHWGSLRVGKGGDHSHILGLASTHAFIVHGCMGRPVSDGTLPHGIVFA